VSGVETRAVSEGEAGVRLDRWFGRHFPALGHGHLQKLLRTGQVRVDGARAKANQRLEAGQRVRVPPLGVPKAEAPRKAAPVPVSDDDAAALRARVLHKDKDILVIDKPEGLAVQGGAGTSRHLDAMLDALRFEASERPRLVHRLDRDTSGCLVLARSAAAAARMGEVFRGRDARKIYWAMTVGVPKPHRGEIDAPLAKGGAPGGERVAVVAKGGERAVTLYAVVETIGRNLAWVALMPVTGRTHQLRVHMAHLGTPILGDGKYGGARAFAHEAPDAKRVHLHAREITLPRKGAPPLRVRAPLPDHMRATWRLFELPETHDGDPFGRGR
jgi:23S rRNA pseudouridine955/2504/2580 synthase